MLGKLTKSLGPITKLVDEIHLSGEEKLKFRQAMFEAGSELAQETLAYEKASLEAHSKMLLAESTGQSWLQRNWRPITMLVFLVLVICDAFDILPFRLADQAWTLLQVGLGGYVVGRSAEKMIPSLARLIPPRK